jgi:dienelactone hydrolase
VQLSRPAPVTEIRELEETLRGQGTSVKVYLYEGAGHGFLAYTRPYYQPDAAQLAQKRTVEFLDSQFKK